MTIRDVRIGQTRTSVEQMLGLAAKVTEEQGYTALWYDSRAPSHANVIFFDDNKVVQVSTSHYKGEERESFLTYLEQYGEPEVSLNKYGGGIQDSFRTTQHIWASEGVAVTTIGAYDISEVIRVDTFRPTKLDRHLKTLGASVAGHQQVVVRKTDVIRNIPSQRDTIVSVSLLFLFLGSMVVYLLRNSHQKNVIVDEYNS